MSVNHGAFCLQLHSLFPDWPESPHLVDFSNNLSLRSLRFSFDLVEFCNPLPWVLSFLSRIPEGNNLRSVTIDLRVNPPLSVFSAFPWAALDEVLVHPKFDLLEHLEITTFSEGRLGPEGSQSYVDQLNVLLPMIGRKNNILIHQLGRFRTSADT